MGVRKKHMVEYDVLFGVVLRISDYDGKGVMKKMDKSMLKLGDLISENYDDCYIFPVGLKEVNVGVDDLSILEDFQFIGDD